MQRLLNIFPSSVTPHPFLPESHRVIMLQTHIPQEQKGFLDSGHRKSYPRAIFWIKDCGIPQNWCTRSFNWIVRVHLLKGFLSYAHYITAIVWPAFEQGKQRWRLQPFLEGDPELAQKLIPPSPRWIHELGWTSRGDQRWQGSFSLRSQLEKWISAHSSSPFLPKSLGSFRAVNRTVTSMAQGASLCTKMTFWDVPKPLSFESDWLTFLNCFYHPVGLPL